jgi:putative proteasome-type protease
MTYCVGVLLREGLIFAADSRTNAGMDHIYTFRKMSLFERSGERFLALLSAGSLATSQAVGTLVSERLESGTEETSLYKVGSMFSAARIVGNALREVLATDGEYVRSDNGDPSASFILGGQIAGRPPRLFQIYSAGNFIEATPETPFVQIGETKYGKPILDRAVEYGMPLARGAKAALVSFDSTMRSNVSVGLPIDLVVYRADSLAPAYHRNIDENDEYFSALRMEYGAGLLDLLNRLPEPETG